MSTLWMCLERTSISLVSGLLLLEQKREKERERKKEKKRKKARKEQTKKKQKKRKCICAKIRCVEFFWCHIDHTLEQNRCLQQPLLTLRKNTRVTRFGLVQVHTLVFFFCCCCYEHSSAESSSVLIDYSFIYCCLWNSSPSSRQVLVNF